MKAAVLSVEDLQKFLDERRLSPEAFAREVKISNMTVRRLLRRPVHSPIPDKYQLQIQKAVASNGNDWASQFLANVHGKGFEPLLKRIEDDGVANSVSLDQIKRDSDSTLGHEGMPKTMKSLVYGFYDFLSKPSPKSKKALAIGALLYFVNPLDLIPDTIVGVGYLDDFAVLTLVWKHLMSRPDTSANASIEV